MTTHSSLVKFSLFSSSSRADPTSCLDQSRLRNQTLADRLDSKESETASGDEEFSDIQASSTRVPYYRPRTTHSYDETTATTRMPSPSTSVEKTATINTELPEVLQSNILGLPDDLFQKLRERYLKLIELEAER